MEKPAFFLSIIGLNFKDSQQLVPNDSNFIWNYVFCVLISLSFLNPKRHILLISRATCNRHTRAIRQNRNAWLGHDVSVQYVTVLGVALMETVTVVGWAFYPLSRNSHNSWLTTRHVWTEACNWVTTNCWMYLTVNGQ